MIWFRPWTVLAVLWTLAVAVLMVLPSSSMDPVVSGWPLLLEVPALDKLLHAGSFGLLAWLWIAASVEAASASPGGEVAPPSPWLLPLFATIAYGALLEGVQGFLPTRATQWTDILANSLGAFAAAALSTRWRSRRVI